MLTAARVQEGIGLVAINDSFCIEGTIYKILKKHFRSDPYYVDIMELFHEVSGTARDTGCYSHSYNSAKRSHNFKFEERCVYSFRDV